MPGANKPENRPRKILTLAIVHEREAPGGPRVLLGMKKRGFGAGPPLVLGRLHGQGAVSGLAQTALS